MEHQSSFVDGGPRTRTSHGKADATTPVNRYLFCLPILPIPDLFRFPAPLRRARFLLLYLLSSLWNGLPSS